MSWFHMRAGWITAAISAVCLAVASTGVAGAADPFESLARYDQAVAGEDDAVVRAAAAELLQEAEGLIELLTTSELSDLLLDLAGVLEASGETELAQQAYERALERAEAALDALQEAQAAPADIANAEFMVFDRVSHLAAFYRRSGQDAERAESLSRRASFLERDFEVVPKGGEDLTALGGGDDEDFETVEVFFGTNRAEAGEGPRDTHSNDRGSLAYGRMEITVPRNRAPGSIPRPAALDPRGARNGVHIVISNAQRFEGEGFGGALNNALDGEAETERAPAMFVFVHGHAVSFDKAARQTAQLAVDLDMRDGATFYSWPNGESVGAYQVSQNNVRLSARHFTRFLTTVLEEAGDSEVHVIAHSMGNRLLLEALEQLSYQVEADSDPLFGQLIWASPDVDAEYFATVIEELAHLSAGMTAYTSSRDRALQLSKALGGNHPRAGQSAPLPQIAEVVTAVDTSDLSIGIGHFDFTHGALNDLRAIVWLSLPPEGRCILDRRDLPEDNQFWRAVDDRPGCDDDAFRRAISAARLYGDEAPARVAGLIERLETNGGDPAMLEAWRQAAAVLSGIMSR